MTTTFVRSCYCCIALLMPFLSWGGQSLVLTANSPIIGLADPIYPQNKAWRVEFQIHDWNLAWAGASGAAPIFNLAGLGAIARLRTDGRLALETRDSVAEGAPCFLNMKGLTSALVRVQKDVSQMRFSCEVWEYDGTGYLSNLETITVLRPTTYGGGNIGGGVTASLGFLRAFTTTVPLGSRPPTTADPGDWTEMKFDGNLSDSSPNRHSGTGSATYGTTSRQVPVALPRTFQAPNWANWLSLRAGFPAKLDGSESYSLADATSAVTFQWQELSGPTTVVWADRTTASPTIRGLIFGSYTFQLTVKDASGSTASATLTAGAVATDNNGVVVNANPDADAIFGPMIAFGKNPWGYADERNLRMENLQKNKYSATPSWATPAEEQTVSHRYFGLSNPMTTISANIDAASLTISVANAGAIDLSSLPTQILIGNLISWEIVRICSSSGNTLQVCYDGRGFHYGRNNGYIRPASGWGAGSGVWQAKVTGDGTHFLTTICGYGAGWSAGSNYPLTSSGSVLMTAGSNSGLGVGTTWNGTQNSLAIAVYAKHSGIPFTFFAYVGSANGTSLTLSRPFPADADTGTYSYRIFSDQRDVVLHYVRSDTTDGSAYFGTAGCESDTALYLYIGWDNQYNNQLVPASPYSYMDGAGQVGDFSPNYYDMGLAHYAFYFRSGYLPSLTAARSIEDYWLRYPEIAQGDAGGSPRSRSILGVVAASVLDGDRASNWSGLRTIAQRGVAVAQKPNCDDDLRETAYQLSWLALAAQFDPDPAQRATWQNAMAAAYSRDNSCRRPDNSFAAGNYDNSGSFPPVVVTQNSPIAISGGGNFPSSICRGVAWGTATIANGSAVLNIAGGTGAFVNPSGNVAVVVGGFRSGVRYDLVTQFDFLSPASLTLAAVWPGDSGTVYWMIENDPSSYVASISTGPADSNYGQVFGCALTDATHMILHRPWLGTSGTNGFSYYNLLGRGTQPFMLGIKVLQMRYAAQIYPQYQDLDIAAANWIATTGFDTATKAITYGRGFPLCEPALTDSGITTAQYRNPNCMENSNNRDAVAQARARNSEAQNAMTVMYLADPTDSNRSIGDLFYGATFGASGFTANGYFSDGVSASNLDDGSLGAYKWPGFFFGVGMAHQWPAARLGGVAPPNPRTVSISFNNADAASAQVLVTAPSGRVATFACGSTSPCPVSVDDRQGSHWFQIRYFSSEGKVIAESDPDLLQVPLSPQ